MNLDPAWIVAIGGAIGSIGWIGQWLNGRRREKTRATADTDAAIASAYKTGVEGFNSLVKNLRDEVNRLHGQVEFLEKQLLASQKELTDVRVDLALNVSENRQLRERLDELNTRLKTMEGKT